MEKRLLREREAAQYIGMSRSYLARSRMEGNLPNHTPGPAWIKCGGRAIRYDVRDLDDWINVHREEPTAWPGLYAR